MSFWKKIMAGGKKPDPVRQVLTELLGTENFTYEFLVILGLERRYEVVLAPGDVKLYLNVLAFGSDCEGRVADLERLRGEDGAAPSVIAWKGCEPLLDGKPYILADRIL